MNRFYLKGIEQLAVSNGKRIFFVYIPGFKTNRKRPSYIRIIKLIGDVWIPPDSIFFSRRNYANYYHFNRRGLTAYSLWLVQQLKESKIISEDNPCPENNLLPNKNYMIKITGSNKFKE